MGQHLSLGVYAAFPESARSLAFRSSSLAQGCKMGLARSATRNAGCPSGLRTCAGSAVMGPGPGGGGRNSCPVAIPPVLLSGEKLGALRSSAAAAGHSVARTHANAADAQPITVGFRNIAIPHCAPRNNGAQGLHSGEA